MSLLFQPWDLGGLHLSNRIVMAPMTRSRSDDAGVPSDMVATYYAQRATAGLISGSFVIETIFNIDGIGLLGYEAIVERDYPTVMGILAITSMLMLVGNIVSDICVALVDPRVRFGE